MDFNEIHGAPIPKERFRAHVRLTPRSGGHWVTHLAPMDQTARAILIVEDHKPTTAVLTRLVTARGFLVVTAASVAEARRAAAENNIGFVITDLGLPDGDGWQLMAELHEQSGVTGAAISGFGMSADLDRSREVGFIMHLVKPISAHQLESLLQMARRELDHSSPPFPGVP